MPHTLNGLIPQDFLFSQKKRKRLDQPRANKPLMNRR